VVWAGEGGGERSGSLPAEAPPERARLPAGGVPEGGAVAGGL